MHEGPSLKSLGLHLGPKIVNFGARLKFSDFYNMLPNPIGNTNINTPPYEAFLRGSDKAIHFLSNLYKAIKPKYDVFQM